MSQEVIALIIAIVGSAVGATWVVSARLASLEAALQVHAEKFKSMSGRVTALEQKWSKS